MFGTKLGNVPWEICFGQFVFVFIDEIGERGVSNERKNTRCKKCNKKITFQEG